MKTWVKGRSLAALLALPVMAGHAQAQTALPQQPAAARQQPMLRALPPVRANGRAGQQEAQAPAQQFAQALQNLAQPAPPGSMHLGLTLEQGNGRMVTLPRAAATVIAADPRVARVQPTSPTSLFVMGVEPGRTTVVATSEDGRAVAELDVTVRGAARIAPAAAVGPTGEGLPPTRAGAVAVRGSVRGNVNVAATPGGYILSGSVANALDAQRAEGIARAFAGDEGHVINNLSVLSSTQVNLRVRVAEISRTLTREFGLNWSAIGQATNFSLGYANIGSLISNVTTSGRLTAGYNGRRFDLNALVDLLASDRLISILAEPNLTAQSGEAASFLAGGEYPIPVAGSITGQISVEFKQYGVSLSFVPTVMAPDRLNLRVRPEVSELSTTGSVSVPLGANGATVTIPALTVRRAETTIELGSGQSFAIAGLLQRNSNQFGQGIQGIEEMPVLGALFRSEQFQRSETELVIIVTPYIVNPVSNPGAMAAPTDGFRPATDLDRILFRRQVARGGAAPANRPAVNAGFMVE